MNELPATVRILDRPYKLKVKPETEQFLRKAAEMIDSQARNYGKMYAYNDRQDLLAMVALTQITQLTKIQENAHYKDTLCGIFCAASLYTGSKTPSYLLNNGMGAGVTIIGDLRIAGITKLNYSSSNIVSASEIYIYGR